MGLGRARSGPSRIEWNQYPGGVRNPNFLTELKRQVDPEALVIFCRSGVRSIGAARRHGRGYNQLL